MTDLWEKAQSDGQSDVQLVADLEHRPPARLQSWELTPADEVSPEGDFPEHGQFMRVMEKSESGQYDDEMWWECPAGLAGMLTESVDEKGGPANVDPADVTVDVDGAAKTEGGAWRFWADVRID